jgi:tropomyosin
MIASVCRLRQVDIKAEHFERQLSRAVEERDAMEKKYDVSLD